MLGEFKKNIPEETTNASFVDGASFLVCNIDID